MTERETFRRKCRHRVEGIGKDYCSVVSVKRRRMGVVLEDCRCQCQRMMQWEKRHIPSAAR